MIRRKGSIDFIYFNKGDYVNSPEGNGIVVGDELTIFNERDFYYSEVKVQYKEASSDNISNEVREVERQNLFRITKEEYDLRDKVNAFEEFLNENKIDFDKIDVVGGHRVY